jgi:hypothetical protein
VRWLVLMILCGSIVSAEHAGRPACNERNVGLFWPDQANWDRQAAKQAVHCGELLLCTRGVWTHSWQAFTVNVTQLGKGPKREIPGCDATHAVVRNDSPTSEIPSSR